MKFLSKLDNGFAKTIDILATIMQIVLFLIILVQVFGRYIFNFALGGWSDVPPYLLIWTVWLTAILAARKNDHLKIEILDLIVKNYRVRTAINSLLDFITAAALITFTVVSVKFIIATWQYGDVNPGLMIKMWILYLVMPFSSAFMSLYYIIAGGKKIQEVVTCRS